MSVAAGRHALGGWPACAVTAALTARRVVMRAGVCVVALSAAGQRRTRTSSSGLTRPVSATIHRPWCASKPEVLAWQPGKPFRREALAVIRQQQGAYEATVNLINKKVIAGRHISGAHIMFTESDYADAGDHRLLGLRAGRASARHCAGAANRAWHLPYSPDGRRFKSSTVHHLRLLASC